MVEPNDIQVYSELPPHGHFSALLCLFYPRKTGEDIGGSKRAQFKVTAQEAAQECSALPNNFSSCRASWSLTFSRPWVICSKYIVQPISYYELLAELYVHAAVASYIGIHVTRSTLRCLRHSKKYIQGQRLSLTQLNWNINWQARLWFSQARSRRTNSGAHASVLLVFQQVD